MVGKSIWVVFIKLSGSDLATWVLLTTRFIQAVKTAPQVLSNFRGVEVMDLSVFRTGY